VKVNPFFCLGVRSCTLSVGSCFFWPVKVKSIWRW